jgi:hypothetical protein
MLAGQLQDLRVAHRFDQVGDFLADAETENRAGLVGADHLLGKHQVAQVGVANLSHHVVCSHLVLLVCSGWRRFCVAVETHSGLEDETGK